MRLAINGFHIPNQQKNGKQAIPYHETPMIVKWPNNSQCLSIGNASRINALIFGAGNSKGFGVVFDEKIFLETELGASLAVKQADIEVLYRTQKHFFAIASHSTTHACTILRTDRQTIKKSKQLG